MTTATASAVTSPALTPSIPQPRAWPLLGNAPAIDPEAPVQSLMRLVQQLGPLFRLTLPGQNLLIVSSRALAAEACDESRFEKHVHGPLQHIRDFAGDGLFTAHAHEENWGKAHRVLMPAFGPAAMKNYFDDMLDVAEQMFTKWQRLGPDTAIDVPDAMTRLTLDTIALCGFGYRFNSFYQREMHPFVEAMVRGLSEAGKRTKRLSWQNQLMFGTRRQYQADTRFMHQVTDEVISRRRASTAAVSSDAARDLLGLMLEGKDPQSGEGLDDANIRHQLVTFLIAGHETTSGLLSFATHLLLTHPQVMAKARAEVDQVLAGAAPRFEHLPRLRYLDQILRETLRLYPTAPAFAVHARHDTTLGGHPLHTGDVALVLLPALHRDPAVWADPERFDPERFAEEARNRLPDKAWMPFGNGLRACIGRSFALQEATLVLAMMLARFEIESPRPYQLVVKETLTLKPAGLELRARPRAPLPQAPVTPVARVAPTTSLTPTPSQHDTPLLVLFGSNTGACEAFARRIAGDGRARGYAVRVAPMDQHAGGLPTTGAVIIVTASYNGQPPDNARRFCSFVSEAPARSLAGVRYAVFGCGNRDWGATYQRVPTTIDEGLTRAGAQPLCPRGEADARGDFFGDFDAWYGPFWDTTAQQLGLDATPITDGPLYTLEVVPSPTAALVEQNHLQLATVLENRELCALTVPWARSKRHLQLALPAGMTYQAGDYLAILPENHPRLIARAAARFGLRPDATVVLHAARGDAAMLPTERPVALSELLGRQVELSAPATRGDLERLAACNPCPPHRAHLEALAADAERHRREIFERRTSVLDLLELFPSCQLPLAAFLEMLPPLRVRQYSLSSSPLADPTRCTLTVAVVEASAWSGIGQFRGTCSSYLAGLAPGDQVAVSVKHPRTPFHPPADNATPVIMIAAGTGLAPFRGFLEERAQRHATQPAGPALLFFGCDHPDVDYLYKDQLLAWQKAGLVMVLPAFFRQPEREVTFVQHRLWQERAHVRALLAHDARIFVCGDGQHMAPAVRATLCRIHQEEAGGSDAEALEWLATLERQGRFATDVFA